MIVVSCVKMCEDRKEGGKIPECRGVLSEFHSIKESEVPWHHENIHKRMKAEAGGNTENETWNRRASQCGKEHVI